MNELWNSLAAAAERTLSVAQHDQLARYLDLLDAANAMMNLTRITARPAAELLHVADSLTLLRLIPPGASRLADVGSGGGVPGIPLAIAMPHVAVLLIESTRKKAAFLKDAVERLGLQNVQVSDQRAEDLARTPARESFDVVTARAVAMLDCLAEYCLPLVKTGGSMLAMKGPRIADELPAAARAIRLLGGGEATVHAVVLPEIQGHMIVEISKRARTADRYPRPPSQQRGRPLG